VIRAPSGTIGSMARAPAGNLAQRTLVDLVNRHPLTAERLRSGGAPFTIRQVQRLADYEPGDYRLAPRVHDGDSVTDGLVEHYAPLLAVRKRGRHSLPNVLLPLKLAVDGHTMLPEYIKDGVVRYLDALADIIDTAESPSDDDDPVQRVADLRTYSLRNNVPDVPGDRKRPPIVQSVFSGFHKSGLNDRDPEDHRYRTNDKAIYVMRSGVKVMSSGGFLDDPELMAKAFQAISGLIVDRSAYQIRLESVADIRDWVTERDWDDRVTEGMKLMMTVGTILGFDVPAEALTGCLYFTVNVLIASDRNSHGKITLPALRNLSTMLRAHHTMTH